MTPLQIAETLMKLGFQAKPYGATKIYLSGYGRDVSAYIDVAGDATGPRLADGRTLTVTSKWRSPQNALRCKGVKHAIMVDLYNADLLTARPPEHWRDVVLDETPKPVRVIRADR